ncbi:hypothetical protein CAL29_04175 [Bordetella genomosp. 10]|uniref:DUF2894 domain-containing protein n=1 Tax=Bordetella genomosp. 10 TaxID=1416804 RepID=A0A261SKA7_9BORD|nr:DUF2894 domain-containing protein [Bordetella genomosp. 10]OZI37605.1 hypothetical protein CAL29_04175 [Bordetella genomosp. 10]
MTPGATPDAAPDATPDAAPDAAPDTPPAPTPEARLAAWREQGWERLDPVAFFFMEALARRTAAHEGEARQRLDARMADLIKAYAARIEKETGENSTDAASRPSPAAPTPLAALRDELTGQAAGNRSALPWTAHYPELPLLDEFQQLWSRVSASLRVQESQFQVPDNAGPLNSSHLVHRSLTLMRELAPGYLHHFLAYVDVLSWLEPMVVPALPQRDAKPAAKASAKTAGARKTATKSTRKSTRAKPGGN